jgi:hypothetical protein
VVVLSFLFSSHGVDAVKTSAISILSGNLPQRANEINCAGVYQGRFSQRVCLRMWQSRRGHAHRIYPYTVLLDIAAEAELSAWRAESPSRQ